MKVSSLSLLAGTALLLSGLAARSAPAPVAAKKPVTGWLNWRGPQQNGTSLETGLPDTVTLGGANDLWHYDLASAGSPVIGNGRLYVLGFRGEGPDLQEVLLCADAENGKKIWDKGF